MKAPLTVTVKFKALKQPVVLTVKFDDMERLEAGDPDALKVYRDALLRAIRTRRQKLKREMNRRKCSAGRKAEIEKEIKCLRRFEHTECGTDDPPCRPSARELGFDTDTPGVEQILEAATIMRYLKTGELMIAKLAKTDPKRWRDLVKREAAKHPGIHRKLERIGYGDISEIKWSDADRVIAEHYFHSGKLKTPLRELSADKALKPLEWLGVEISLKAYDLALRRLFLVEKKVR